MFLKDFIFGGTPGLDMVANFPHMLTFLVKKNCFGKNRSVFCVIFEIMHDTDVSALKEFENYKPSSRLRIRFAFSIKIKLIFSSFQIYWDDSSDTPTLFAEWELEHD